MAHDVKTAKSAVRVKVLFKAKFVMCLNVCFKYYLFLKTVCNVYKICPNKDYGNIKNNNGELITTRPH